MDKAASLFVETTIAVKDTRKARGDGSSTEREKKTVGPREHFRAVPKRGAIENGKMHHKLRLQIP